MNSAQDARLKSYLLIKTVCQANAAAVDSNVAFKTLLTGFLSKVDQLALLAQADDVPITGITQDKNQIKKQLCERTAALANVVFVYAATTNDNTLKAKVSFSETQLNRLRAEELAPHCQNIHDAAAENLAQLADYGITAAILTNIQTRINAYSQAFLKPSLAKNDRKINNAKITALIKEITQLLDERLNRLALTFKMSHPDFFEQYEQARKVEEPPVTHTQLKITVTDKATQSPINNAQVTALLQDAEEPPLTAATAPEGIAHFKPVHYGDYDITITATGYETYETEIIAVMGEINELEVELEN